MWYQIIFENILKLNWTHPITKLNTKKELLCEKIFGSGRNVYVIEEPFYFHST
jgi:hypothetical protein